MIPGPAGRPAGPPLLAERRRPVPAIAYYHGGGHVIGSLDTHDLIARNLCSGPRRAGRFGRLPDGAGAQIPGGGR